MKLTARRLASLPLIMLVLTGACSSAKLGPTTAAPAVAPSTSLPTATERPPTETPVPTATATPYPVFWDDFDGALQPGWTWIRENDALWSLTSEPGFLRIVLQGGAYPRNLLLRDVGSDNFQIMTHVLFKPTSNFQVAGVVFYQDDDTRLTLGRAYCNVPGACVGNGIYFDVVQSSQFVGPNFGTDTQLKDEAYLRLDKVGSVYTGYYSEDGADWMMIGKHEVSLTDPKVGLMAGQSNVVGATALFDYFTVMEMP